MKSLVLVMRALLLLAALPALSFAQGGVVEYYHLDALGTVRAVTDQNGTVLERHDYLPFGEELCASGATYVVCGTSPVGGSKRFTGKERDAETGLDYFGARYYGSKVGRFTTVDPVYMWKENLVDPQRWNRYAYVRNNPLRYVDPDGRVLQVAGDVGRAVAALQSTVPSADRSAIRVVLLNGQPVIDARALNGGGASGSENFLAIQQIANSPGAVELNVSAPDLQMRINNTVSSIPFGPKIFGYTGVGANSATPGTTQVFVNPGLDTRMTAKTTAHELRHARRYLLGQTASHEYTDKSQTRLNPAGAVNLETGRAAAEAERNQRKKP